MSKDLYKNRLLNIAVALRDMAARRASYGLPESDGFDMQVYANTCGTPSCAFGHYAAREDLQDAFGLSRFGVFAKVASVPIAIDTRYISYDSPVVLSHFGIGSEEAHELFNPCGCDNAETEEEAARYIESFCERVFG